MSEDKFFKATGPSSPSPNDTPGFFTNGTRIWRGAELVVKLLGLRATGSDDMATGVVGKGGPGGVGVVGLTAANDPNNLPAIDPAGVIGFGDETSSAGVRGQAPGPNDGVVGESKSVRGVTGAGVRGIARDSYGVLGEGFTGVYGEGSTTGVKGSSETGTGVYGESVGNFGGVFASNKQPQLLIVPSDAFTNPRQLPSSEAGSFAVVNDRDPETGRIFARLWFCTLGGGPGVSQWKNLA